MHPHHPPRPCPPCPPRPAPPAGLLVQKIIACEKRHLPCVNAEWRMPACGHGTVQSVTACGAPVWTLADGCRLRITLPVSVRLCDSCGRCSSHTASLELETDLPRSFHTAMDDPRNALLILPCVRLIRAECACDGCFRVQLAVSLEMYLLRYQVLHGGPPMPQCPQLPLYPQPMC